MSVLLSGQKHEIIVRRKFNKVEIGPANAYLLYTHQQDC